MKITYKILVLFSVLLTLNCLVFAQENPESIKPDNLRTVGEENILVRHAFPSKVRVEPYLSHDKKRDMIVSDEMLQYLKEEKIMVIFDLADLWTPEEVEHALNKYNLIVSKQINFFKTGYDTEDEIKSALTDKNLKYFLDTTETAKEKGMKVSVHCWSGMHRAGLMSAIYLMEREGYTNEEAVNYWKKNGAFSGEFDEHLRIIAEVEGWDESKVENVRERSAAIIFPAENGITTYLRNYKLSEKK